MSGNANLFHCRFIIFHIQINPNRPRHPEKPHEQNRDDNEQYHKGCIHGQIRQPKQRTHETKAEERRDDVGNEHCTVVEARAEEVFLATFWASFGHVEGLVEGKRAGREEVAFVAAWTFEVEDAVGFRAFFEQTHFSIFDLVRRKGSELGLWAW